MGWGQREEDGRRGIGRGIDGQSVAFSGLPLTEATKVDERTTSSVVTPKSL